jgi:CheY-like chemotaxis protein
MIYQLGTQAGRVVEDLRTKIRSGALVVGTKLPPHKEIASHFGVAPLTARHALSVLESEGLISREQGRGTFVRLPPRARVLIADDDPMIREILRDELSNFYCDVFEADNPMDALAILKEQQVSLVISDVRMPNKKDGIGFIREVRQTMPRLPIAALTGFPEDLTPLLGTAECPVLILSKPIIAKHLEDLLSLVLN